MSALSGIAWMTRLTLLPLLLIAGIARAQTCEYKAVMTDAEVEACRHPITVAKTLPRHVEETKQPLDTSAAGYAARLDAENTRQRREGSPYTRSVAARQKATADAAHEAALQNAPSEPQISMTTADAELMLEANRRNKRWGDWSFCSGKNKTTNSSGVHEQWVCGVETARSYLYFDNGVLTSFQSR